MKGSWRLPEPFRRRTAEVVDMGGGRYLPVSDLLDGHCQRLMGGQREHNAMGSSATVVPVMVRGNLQAAIAVVAPEWAPLAQLAEGVSGSVATVQPAPKFRQELATALALTQRQQMAQRKLGTRGMAAPPRSLLQDERIGLLALLVAAALLLAVWRRQKR